MKVLVYLAPNSKVLYSKKLTRLIKTLTQTKIINRQKKKRKLQPRSKILNRFFLKLNLRRSLNIRHCLQYTGNKTYQNLRILIQIKRKKILGISKKFSLILNSPRNLNFLKLLRDQLANKKKTVKTQRIWLNTKVTSRRCSAILCFLWLSQTQSKTSKGKS